MTTSDHDTTAHRPANLAALLVREIRTSRRLRLHLWYAIEQRRALADALHAAVATIGDLSKKLDRARQNALDLRDENRRIVRAKFTDEPPSLDESPSEPRTYAEAVQ